MADGANPPSLPRLGSPCSAEQPRPFPIAKWCRIGFWDASGTTLYNQLNQPIYTVLDAFKGHSEPL